jgi:hypothetical protein
MNFGLQAKSFDLKNPIYLVESPIAKNIFSCPLFFTRFFSYPNPVLPYENQHGGSQFDLEQVQISSGGIPTQVCQILR